MAAGTRLREDLKRENHLKKFFKVDFFYFSEIEAATSCSERTTHIALLSLFQTGGFILGPGLMVSDKELALPMPCILVTKCHKMC